MSEIADGIGMLFTLTGFALGFIGGLLLLGIFFLARWAWRRYEIRRKQ